MEERPVSPASGAAIALYGRLGDIPRLTRAMLVGWNMVEFDAITPQEWLRALSAALGELEELADRLRAEAESL